MVKENRHHEAVCLQISVGQGPKECGWVVAQLMKRVVREAGKRSISAEIIESLAFDKAMRQQNLIEVDAYLSSLIRLEGIGAKNFARSWSGPILWQGKSRYRPKHKRSNWFVGIEPVFVDDTKEMNMHQLACEITVETMRAGGPGGQHVNKTSSAVRITHRPTGIQVRAESERSQHRNRQQALERLQLKLFAGEAIDRHAQTRDRWLKHYQLVRGNPVRVFHGADFKEKR
ncbi:peptide chain release factor H [Microbulbifer spongiae]|uniref:Peptide chain release factor H n=1 Tax=Microbulbifer spongiae TaxID=2944933 RepID=A0ABY9ED01_9GAMM|nr:peptide chain release factor H [Microbulbifer sp. MI-G]WKD50147.1 peptide chain release factor H [Microbulbifer sp. MI-G]